MLATTDLMSAGSAGLFPAQAGSKAGGEERAQVSGSGGSAGSYKQ